MATILPVYDVTTFEPSRAPTLSQAVFDQEIEIQNFPRPAADPRGHTEAAAGPDTSSDTTDRSTFLKWVMSPYVLFFLIILAASVTVLSATSSLGPGHHPAHGLPFYKSAASPSKTGEATHTLHRVYRSSQSYYESDRLFSKAICINTGICARFCATTYMECATTDWGEVTSPRKAFLMTSPHGGNLSTSLHNRMAQHEKRPLNSASFPTIEKLHTAIAAIQPGTTMTLFEQRRFLYLCLRLQGELEIPITGWILEDLDSLISDPQVWHDVDTELGIPESNEFLHPKTGQGAGTEQQGWNQDKEEDRRNQVL